MLRIYLDQAEWIDLSKCRAGRRDGDRFRDVYAVASEAVRGGHASFVLSCAHYYETHHRAGARSRAELADTMAELSQFHTLAPPMVVVPAEIEEFLTGRPVTEQVNLFGVGIEHAFDADFGFNAPTTKFDRVPSELRSEAKRRASWLIERTMLAGQSTLVPGLDQRVLDTARTLKNASQKFVDSQNAVADYITANKIRHPDRLADVVAASEIADFIDPLLAGCNRNGIDAQSLLQNRDSMQKLLRGLPSRWVTSELRRARLRNPQKAWEKNDLNDLLALSTAVPYCDVVVTENEWVHHLTQLGLADRYGTIVLADLTELTDVLVAASVQAS
ncbi:hypothetical protein [Nocardia asiatica]|uniref:hypothetical protein n=1 Tax=Nocardia asiatica TaxID=209252 RepID=UPI0024540D74|nr:hypothetical protein [Nocardia asiatica]